MLNPIQPKPERPEALQRNDTTEAQPDIAPIAPVARTLSHKTGKTLLSGTEATHYHQSLDEIIDAKSVTSYAVTVKDVHGKGVELPPPPKTANGEKDFECPYCYIICPARYGYKKQWRNHVLSDIQPYICTYPECDSPELLFSKRREWIEHEASHRKAWRCPEHTTAVYRTRAGLEDHLRSNHMDSFPASQISAIADVGETTTVDVRQTCPVCHVPADDEGLGDFHNHIANHLERIAAFALPNAVGDDSDGASSIASRGWSGTSQDLSDLSFPSEVTKEVEEREKNAFGKLSQFFYAKFVKTVGLTATHEDISDDTLATDLTQEIESSRAFLSAESLQQLPDMTQNRLEMTAAQVETQNEIDESPTGGENVGEEIAGIQDHLDQRDTFRKYLLSLPGAESVRFFRRYGSWTGQAMFQDDTTAAQAAASFDIEQFPYVKIQQIATSSNKLKFSTSNLGDRTTKPPDNQPKRTVEGEDDVRSDSSASIEYDEGDKENNKGPILTVSEISNLRSLYRSGRLLQRDQSFNPNDRYNQVISLCYSDLTTLRVDAIINSADTTLKNTRMPTTLNHAIFKAGGPGLNQEAKTKGKLKPGQVELTHGHNLPSKW